MKAFGFKLFAPAVPRLILLLATFAQPLLVDRTVQFVADPGQSNERAWALVSAFGLLYALMSLTTSLYWEKVRSTPTITGVAANVNIGFRCDGLVSRCFSR